MTQKRDVPPAPPAQVRPSSVRSPISQRCAALINTARLNYRLNVGLPPGSIKDR
jgi:hypothetical protein